MDPRFVRPTMRDKALSGIDTEISNILNSHASDEIKAASYMSALTRFKNYSNPPKSEVLAPATPAAPAAPAAPAHPAAAFKVHSVKRKRAKAHSPPKRTKVTPSDIFPSIDPPTWKHTQRIRKRKNFGPQWIEYSGQSAKKKSPTSWIET